MYDIQCTIMVTNYLTGKAPVIDAPAKNQHASHENVALDDADPGPHLREIVLNRHHQESSHHWTQNRSHSTQQGHTKVSPENSEFDSANDGKAEYFLW